MRLHNILMVTVLLVCTATAAGAANFKLDGGHSHFGLSVAHFGVSRMHCSFAEVSGTVVMDEEDFSKSSVEIIVKTESLISEFKDRVDAVKSEFFLNVAEYPEITFKSKEVRKDGDTYHLKGDLTIHGVTKEVEFPFELVGPIPDPFGNPRIGVNASLTINRQDYGIAFDRKTKEGVPLVGDDVQITLNVEAVNVE